ncbi:hypothetical protein SORBI_3008G061900 [Sorghum bicolor]|uniref:Uncharacterized protein n=1 Tax=Sorghum bicolor TaxID=4558 RepID=C5YT70_SORBI|nr:hypothetical protein SORBI_3008G061900 [Sorghum bicolor]
MTTTSTSMPAAAAMEMMQKLPMAVSTCWKWPTLLVLSSTRCAALPKKVRTPVAMTTASISPCFTVEPENTSCPGCLFTGGSDSPVSADWSILTLERVALEQPGVGGDDVAELDADDVTGHEDRRVLLLPPAVPQQLGLGRQPNQAMSAAAAFPALASSM